MSQITVKVSQIIVQMSKRKHISNEQKNSSKEQTKNLQLKSWLKKAARNELNF